MEFERDGGVGVSPLSISNETLRDLEEHLLMFFTGYSRAADFVLEEQKTRSEDGDVQMVDNLHQIKELGFEVERRSRVTTRSLSDASWTAIGSTRGNAQRRCPIPKSTGTTSWPWRTEQSAANWWVPGPAASFSFTQWTKVRFVRPWRPRG